MIIIRVDANDKIAMGHVSRCMTIAMELRMLGQEILFVISDSFSKEYIESKGFECICLNNSYTEKEAELDELKAIIERRSANVLFIDSYQVSDVYFDELHKNIRIVYIDDLRSKNENIDIIINYAIDAEKSWYINRENHTKLLLGSSYAPIRKEFSDRKPEIQASIKRIFITSGGTDPYNMLLEMVQALLIAKEEIEVHVVAGKFYKNIELLKEVASRSKNVNVYFDIPDIYNVMMKCDIAISAGGTTLAELCTMGIPTIAYTMADNQINGTMAMDRIGIVKYAGDIRNGKDITIHKILEIIDDLNSQETRQKLSAFAKHMYHGKGALKIAEEICAGGT